MWSLGTLARLSGSDGVQSQHWQKVSSGKGVCSKKVHLLENSQRVPRILVAPYRAILRDYRCDTPYRAILFQGGWHSPKMVRYPPLVLSFTQAHLCDTPFCNISRDNCAIPHKKQARKSFAILSLQASRDMKSIATGPLSPELTV